MDLRVVCPKMLLKLYFFADPIPFPLANAFQQLARKKIAP